MFFFRTQAEAVKQLYGETQVSQDLLVPQTAMADCIRKFDKWLCPMSNAITSIAWSSSSS